MSTNEVNPLGLLFARRSVIRNTYFQPKCHLSHSNIATTEDRGLLPGSFLHYRILTRIACFEAERMSVSIVPLFWAAFLS